jgi:hypothetical protein
MISELVKQGLGSKSIEAVHELARTHEAVFEGGQEATEALAAGYVDVLEQLLKSLRIFAAKASARAAGDDAAIADEG